MKEQDSIWSPRLSSADADAYDSFIATAAGGHYSQRRAWAAVAAAGGRFTPTYFFVRRRGFVIGAALVLRPLLLGFALPVAKIERGPVCDCSDQLPYVIRELLGQAHRHGIARLSVMPYWAGDRRQEIEAMLRQQGFVNRQSFSGRHARSLRLDLTTLPQGDPFGSSNLSKVRHEVRRAERSGATVRRGSVSDLREFREIYEEFNRLERKTQPPAAWYNALGEYFLSTNGAMFVCEHDRAVVSAVFVARHGTVATYVIGAGRNVRFPKLVLPLASAIIWAKENGLQSFDFGGIPMKEDPDIKRTSIAEFKYSFSRSTIDLVQEHVRWF